MAIVKETLRPLEGGRGYARMRIDDDVLRRTTKEEQDAAREYARRLAAQIAIRHALDKEEET